jgi:Uma2 family endonuclease
MNDKHGKQRSEAVKEQMESYDELNGTEHGSFIEERYEIIDNIRYDLKPSPTVKHQKLVANLYQALYQTCHDSGVILFAPIDVYLNEENIFQPDLVFISNENEQIIKESRIEGAPDLVAEILSPSTSKNDKIRKKAQYERFGVKEYWIADPIHFIIDQFVLDHGQFRLQATFGDGDTISSDLFSCISVDLGDLFDQLR